MATGDVAQQMEAVRAAIRARIEDAIEHAANGAYGEARELVPVRKVFKGGRNRKRFLSGAELTAERDIRTKLFGGPATGPIQVVTRRSPVHALYPRLSPRIEGRINVNLRGGLTVSAIRSDIGSLRTVSKSGKSLEAGPVVEKFALSSQGRAELKSGRAISELQRRGRTIRIVGGALRASIRIGNLVVDGANLKRSVIAGNKKVHYAKYVEFGTRHAAAQPFMRPALAKIREEYRQRMARSLSSIPTSASRGPMKERIGS